MIEMSDTKKRIIEAAQKLFAENGYRTTTTRSIAKEAHVSELTLFRNFETKERLLSAVIDNMFDLGSFRSAAPIERTGILEEDLFSLVKLIRTNIRKRKDLYRLLLMEHSTNELVRDKLRVMPGSIKTMMVGIMGDILRPHARDDIDVETASVFFMSYFFRSEIFCMMVGEDPFHEVDDRRTREAIDIFLHGVLGREAVR